MATSKDESVPDGVLAHGSGQPPPPATLRFYRPELDALRFFAFLWVFVFHTWSTDPAAYGGGLIGRAAPTLVAVVTSGGYGVDLFFLLSAYLITELLLREKDTRGVLDVRSFWLRRILRIWPLYFFFLGLMFAWQWLDNSLVFPARSLLAFLLLAGNWVLLTPGMVPLPVYPLWSVSVEEQFYLLWPLVVRTARRPALQRIALVLLVFTNLFRYLSLHFGFRLDHFYWPNTFARLDPIAVGILLATALRGRTLPLPAWLRPVMFLAGIALWAWVGLYLDSDRLLDWAVMAGYPLRTAASGCIFLSVLGSTAVHEGSPLTWLGKISYGLYVFHVFAVYLLHLLFPRAPHRVVPFLGYWLLTLVLTVALAAVSYRWLETPFLRLKRRFTYIPSRPLQEGTSAHSAVATFGVF